MEQNIISAEEVIAEAFTDGEYIAPAAISHSDITAAIERWILPITGQALLTAVETGNYQEFATQYLRPTIAAFTRLGVQPRLNVATGQLGLSLPRTSYNKVADQSMRHELMTALKRRAYSLRRRMSRYLDANASAMPEYNPKENILKRCCCDGGIVQVH